MNEFEEFRTAVGNWSEALGLTDWQITVLEADLGRDHETVVARTALNWTQRSAAVRWNQGYRAQPDGTAGDNSPASIALHEVLHIALHTFAAVATETRDLGSDLLDSEEHGLIRRLMRAMQELGK